VSVDGKIGVAICGFTAVKSEGVRARNFFLWGFELNVIANNTLDPIISSRRDKEL
jgi:hypothetical protein